MKNKIENLTNRAASPRSAWKISLGLCDPPDYPSSHIHLVVCHPPKTLIQRISYAIQVLLGKRMATSLERGLPQQGKVPRRSP